jgi:hypothetical protein
MIPKDGDVLLNHILSVAGDEIWVSFLNNEIKEPSKQWMHRNSPKKTKNIN